jgi:ATP-dependent RNA helicase DeaD
MESGFSQWSLSQEVLKSITHLGYKDPTPVQAACIPVLLEQDTDLLALAKTGTGKTAAFGIPLAEKLKRGSDIQALVLCPTRELASQVASNLQSIGSLKGLKVATILGGESYRKQFDALKLRPEIVVSTPGRLIDLLDQKALKLDQVKYLILDEADEMLSIGFKDALESIWKTLESNEAKAKTWLFSATMSSSILKLTSEYLNKPVEVMLNEKQTPIRVQSFAAVVYEEDKLDALALAILNEPQFYGIVFAQTKKQVADLEILLRSLGLDVDCLHGDKAQADRNRTITRFKKRETKILVATDVAARGLDVADLTHVVNFELPWDVETYTHRIGRTARAGKEGTVWNFVRPKEVHQLRRFERALKTEFKSLRIPTKEEVDSAAKLHWLKSVDSVVRPNLELVDVLFDKYADELPAASPETRIWLSKVLVKAEVGVPHQLKQPRSFDLHKQDQRSQSQSRTRPVRFSEENTFRRPSGKSRGASARPRTPSSDARPSRPRTDKYSEKKHKPKFGR